MTNRPSYSMPRMLLTVVCCTAAATAQAAAGYNVTPEQFGQVRQGMSRSEVLQTLGNPAIKQQYGNQPGDTWVYRLLSFGNRHVHIDFGVDGSVVAASKRLDYSGNSVP